jgi:ribosomal protein L37AE/L43A
MRLLLDPIKQGNAKRPQIKPSTVRSKKKSDKNEFEPSDAIEKASEKSNREGRVRDVMFCPKCGSLDVYWASGLPQPWSVWDCRNCGYRGTLVLRDSKLARKLREEYAKSAER